MKEANLIILARYPEPGIVKTRLGSEIGYELAADIYRAMLVDILRRFTTLTEVPILLSINADDNNEGFQRIISDENLPKERIEIHETPGDMYQKTVDAYRYSLERYKKAILLPVDLPYFSPEQFARIVKELENADVVFHPNTDDGCAPHSLSRFADLWTGSDSRAQGYILSFLERVHTLGLKHVAMEPLFDIDYVRDLLMFFGWMKALPQSHSAFCPSTVAVIGKALPILQSLRLE